MLKYEAETLQKTLLNKCILFYSRFYLIQFHFMLDYFKCLLKLHIVFFLQQNLHIEVTTN
jgi:hypothetical protein